MNSLDVDEILPSASISVNIDQNDIVINEVSFTNGISSK